MSSDQAAVQHESQKDQVALSFASATGGDRYRGACIEVRDRFAITVSAVTNPLQDLQVRL